MPLSWNEIKMRATTFSKKWEDESSEDAEAKSFWDDFFNVFGISRRRVATFEHAVKTLPELRSAGQTKTLGAKDKYGYIDLLWKGIILIEHKSRGKDLDRAFGQAKDYFPGLKEKELPRYILVSDFERFRLYDLEENTQQEFNITQFVDKVHLFGFIAGYQKRTYKEQDPVNIEAAELMGKLHDKLKAIGYDGHPLEVYLVRLLFCLFADDTGIFDRDIFHEYLELKTNEDGSDLAAHISQLFTLLNTETNKRLKNIDESLQAFPYVNGKLFEETLPFASFDSEMRKLLLDCCLLDWGKISPAIFGSLFQSVMDSKARRNLGAHYTSEKNILKLIKPLFLDDLKKEYETVKESKPKLQKFHDKISKLRFLDPACGCGNFLIIAYRELRMLELDVIKTLLFRHEKLRAEVAAGAGIDVGHLVKCDVDMFYGIEYEEFPAQIAQVAMWLIDHQMNQLVTQSFGEYYVRLPLRKSATIAHGNALRIEWQSLIDPMPWEKEEARYHYILGNPPFSGKSLQNAEQKADMDIVFAGVNGAGVLDYVTAWYIRAAQYMQTANKFDEPVMPKTGSAFVSTNSIAQGEQVGILWNELFNRFQNKIHFVHNTFKWGNEGKANAGVYVVIIGFANYEITNKIIYDYNNVKGDALEKRVWNINPYLIEGKDIILKKRAKPICKVPEIAFGSMPNDGGGLLLNDVAKINLTNENPGAEKYVRPLLSAHEFIHGEKRWCLWLKDVAPNELKGIPEIIRRLEIVKAHRNKSSRPATQKLASFPTIFGEIRQPDSDFILIPRHSSENRKYIPMGFFSKTFIVSDSCLFVANASLYTFGVMMSAIHMTWVNRTCGRLESRFRYSNEMVYNNFPWPENSTDKQSKAVETAAQQVLDARLQFPDSSLADLYDPNTMPPVLVKAHQALDKAVDLCYRPQPFLNETKRIEFLFELYDKYTAGMFGGEGRRKKRK